MEIVGGDELKTDVLGHILAFVFEIRDDLVELNVLFVVEDNAVAKSHEFGLDEVKAEGELALSAA